MKDALKRGETPAHRLDRRREVRIHDQDPGAAVAQHVLDLRSRQAPVDGNKRDARLRSPEQDLEVRVGVLAEIGNSGRRAASDGEQPGRYP